VPDVYRIHQLTRPQVTKQFGVWRAQCIMCMYMKVSPSWHYAYASAYAHANTSPLHRQRQMLKLKRQLGEFPDEA
jgi:hypothetical protein